MSALCWTLKETLMVFAIAFCGLARCFRTALSSSSSLPFALRECLEWPVPGGRHGVFWCLLPRPLWYLSQVAHREGLLTNTLGVVALFLIAVVIHTVDVATSVFGREAPITSPHDLRLGKVLSFCHRFQRSESHAQITNRDERLSRSVREELLWRR